MTSIEISRVLKIEYLESLSGPDLAFWLVQSFSPARYHDENDVIKDACELLYRRAHNPVMTAEFLDRLWGMFGMEPDAVSYIHRNNIIDLKRRAVNV
jgi:hypothetical protein